MKNNEENNMPRLKSCKKFNKKPNQNIAELKQKLTTAKQFIEYFVIIGLDPKISVENFLYNSSLEDLEIFHSNELKPEIITKYPPISKSYINVDDNLSESCFPNGLKLERHEQEPKPEILKFLLGNYFYSIDYPLKYITCLKIYESLENYRILQKKLKNSLGINSFNIRKSSKNFFSHKSTKDDEKNDDNNTVFRKTLTSSKNLENFDLLSSYDDNNKIKECDFNKYYFPKILCFVSLKPFYKYHEEILLQIYDYYKSSNKLKIPLEKIILNILINIPIPPRGLNIYNYQLNEKYKKIEIKSDKMNKLRNIDEDLVIALKFFTLTNFIEIFKYVLFETKTIVFCKNINDLCIFINVLLSILYPFIYPFQVSSSLHKNAFEVLESISPYIIGINRKYTEKFFKDNKIEIKGSNILIIDLDQKEFIMKYVDEVPNIPKSLVKKLKTKIENNLKKYSKNKIDENEENWLCYPFFDFFLNILYNYKDYLNNENLKNNYKISSLKILFKIKEYVESYSNNERPFYKKLVETQMFNDFIFKKMIPKDVNDKLEILFFDECLKRKNNKKFFSINKPILFLNSKEYEYNEEVQILIVKELTKKEKNIFKDNDNILKNLLFGQDVIIEKNIKKVNDDEELDLDNEINDEIEFEDSYYFNYLLFPKFNKDYFNDPSDYSMTSPDIDYINRINTYLLAKSHQSPGEINENYQEMQDYIYLTYIEVWGYSYYYQESNERDYRFEQMLKVLDKIKHQEIELINVLFESLNKFQEKEKIIRLYNKILDYKITPNNFIYSIVGKIAQKSSGENFDFIKEIKKNDTSNFLRRTFRSQQETNILFDTFSFNYISNCPECNELIDIENISTDYKRMKKDTLWAKCPVCLNDIKPQMSINFGNSISSKSSYFPCSKVETFTLSSPYELKNILKDIIDKDKFQYLEVEKFKEKYNNYFWSCIWYFKLNNLDYNIILPYEENIFTKKTNCLNGINFHYISSKILENFKTNDNIINQNHNIIQENNSNNSSNDKSFLYVIQNIYSFCYIKNICYDYFGIFKKYNKVEFYNYISNRRNTFANFKLKNKITINNFINLGSHKTLTDKKNNKNRDSHRSPGENRKKQNNNFPIDEHDELEELKFAKQYSEDINNIKIEDNLNEINDIKPIKILTSINENINNDSRKNSSSSLSEENSNGS